MSTPLKPSFLLDTGPLSVLCGFPAQKPPYIHLILQYANLVIPDVVVNEIGVGKMARVALPLLKSGAIKSAFAPALPAILDKAYGEGLGAGERAAIKCALQTGLLPVIDDQSAFVVACRFGLHPIGFQDFIVQLVKENELPKKDAVEVVRTTARQFPAMYLVHTLDILG